MEALFWTSCILLQSVFRWISTGTVNSSHGLPDKVPFVVIWKYLHHTFVLYILFISDSGYLVIDLLAGRS